MFQVDRRSVLAYAATGFGCAGLQGLGLGHAAGGRDPSRAPGKLLVILLRGGHDGLNAVLPAGDPGYVEARPRIAVPAGRAIDAGNGFAAFHPALRELVELHERGELASLHRVGHPFPAESHFVAERVLCTARPDDPALEEGFLARWAGRVEPASALAVLGVSARPMRLFRSDRFPIAHVSELEPGTYRVKVASAPSGSGGGARAGAAARIEAEVAAALRTLPELDAAERFPTDGAALAAAGLPDRGSFRRFNRDLRGSLRVLKSPSSRVVGMESTGWDDHRDQGGAEGNHADRLRLLAHGIAGVRAETEGELWDRLVVLVLSEFGRSSAENRRGGTDHGSSGLVWVAGGRVRGGVHGCEADTWEPGRTLFSERGRSVRFTTDYRTVLASVLGDHLDTPPAVLDDVIPGWSRLPVDGLAAPRIFG